MNNQHNLPRHMLVALALLGGTIGLTAGSSYAAVPTSPSAPAEAEVAPTETEVTEADSHGCGEDEILSEAEFAADFEALSEAERASLVEQMSADAAGLMAELDAKGIEYTTEVDAVTGVEWPGVEDHDAATIDVFEGQVFTYELAADPGAVAENLDS